MELLYIEYGIDQVLLLSTLKARSRPSRLFKVPGAICQSDPDDNGDAELHNVARPPNYLHRYILIL